MVETNFCCLYMFFYIIRPVAHSCSFLNPFSSSQCLVSASLLLQTISKRYTTWQQFVLCLQVGNVRPEYWLACRSGLRAGTVPPIKGVGPAGLARIPRIAAQTCYSVSYCQDNFESTW